MRHVATPAPINKCWLKAQRVTPTQEVGCQDHVAVGGVLVGKQETEARRPRDIDSSHLHGGACQRPARQPLCLPNAEAEGPLGQFDLLPCPALPCP